MASSDVPPPPPGVIAELAPGRIALRWKPAVSRPPSPTISRYHVF